MLRKEPVSKLIVCCFVMSLTYIQFGHAQDSQVNALETEALPSLMSLQQALNLASVNHPSLLSSQADIKSAQAKISNSTIPNRWNGSLIFNARNADLINDEDHYKNDSYTELSISKQIWDFGRADANRLAADLDLQAHEINATFVQRLQRIKIMSRFLQVIAADIRFGAENEAMSLAFFPFSRAEERRERFGSVSELEVMEKRVDYFDELSQRNQAIRNQRASRFKLALAMGRPKAQPDGLIEPDLSAYARELPDFDTLMLDVLAANPRLKQSKTELKQLMLNQENFKLGKKPTLKLKLSAYEYDQTHRSRDKGRGLLALEIPLFKGSAIAAQQAEIAATIYHKEAQILSLDYEIREQVLNWVQRLEALNQEIEQNVQNLEYRERELDKSRLLYEMDVRARIGQAQADMAKLLWQDAEIKFERAIIWEQIDAVLGTPVVEFE